MSSEFTHAEDFNLAQRCLEFDEIALLHLRDNFASNVRAYLLKMGARADEADETVDSLWADCLTPLGDGRSRLAHYDGRAALQTWLHTVAFHLLLAKKRADSRRERLLAPAEECSEEDEGSASAPLTDDARHEAPLLDLMRSAIEFGFTTCPSQDFVLLQLEHCDRLEREDLARMFGCSKATISRLLDRARTEIEKRTLGYLRERDPWIEIKWEDFLELCDAATPACFGLAD